MQTKTRTRLGGREGEDDRAAPGARRQVRERAIMPVRQYLDLSTAHLPEREREALTRKFDDVDGQSPLVVLHGHGAWMHVVDDVDDLSEEFARAYPATHLLVSQARGVHGCDWINLDADADTHPGLPTYSETA